MEQVSAHEMDILKALWLLTVKEHMCATIEQIDAQRRSLPKDNNPAPGSEKSGIGLSAVFTCLYENGRSLFSAFLPSSPTAEGLKSLEAKGFIKSGIDYTDRQKVKFRIEKSGTRALFDRYPRYEYPYPNGLLSL